MEFNFIEFKFQLNSNSVNSVYQTDPPRISIPIPSIPCTKRTLKVIYKALLKETKCKQKKMGSRNTH